MNTSFARLNRRAVVVGTLALIVTASVAFSYRAPVIAHARADVHNPSINFCPNSVSSIDEVSTDNAAGVTWASSIDAPLSGGNVGIYFKNNGSDPITFADPNSWSVKGNAIQRGTSTSIPLTPKGSSAVFNDGFWAGTFGGGTDILGCTDFSSVVLKPQGEEGTAHLDLSFYRGSNLYKVRVDVHFRNRDGRENDRDRDNDR